MKTLALGLSFILLLYLVFAIAVHYLILDDEKKPNVIIKSITNVIDNIFRNFDKSF